MPRAQPVKSVNVIIRRWCIFLSVTSSDSQTFGTDWILKTMKPVKISQILLQDVKSVSKTGMIHLTILNPEGMHIFEETDAWVEEILCSTGRYVPQLRGIFSVLDTRITFPARINIKKDTYVSKDNISDPS